MESLLESPIKTRSACNSHMLPIRDALSVLHGKWKIPIISVLSFGNKRFKEISLELHDITDKMLSKELKELEQNKLITRHVIDTFPPKVEYSITEHGKSLQPVILALQEWGNHHRNLILDKKPKITI